jgi:Uma2 family endonuclease
MPQEILRKKFTIAQYHRTIETAILTDRDRVELIEGEIIEKSPVGRRHAACVDRLNEIFVLQVASEAIVRIQNPIKLSDNSEPQPDIALVRRQTNFYVTEHPQPKDIFLVVEVSDTTTDYDRQVKIPLYATEQISEAWLIDLNTKAIEVYRQPTPSGYLNVRICDRNDSIVLQAFPDISFSVDSILGSIF